MKQIIAANKIFTGTEWLINHALVIQDNMVESILPTVALKETASLIYKFMEQVENC
jgi:N-acetylglucosamine-6-phosphate deacetylase